MQDLNEIIENSLENKIALVRQHATRVRIHALLVNEYLSTLKAEWTFLSDQEQVMLALVHSPERFNIMKHVQIKHNVSPFDLPAPSVYEDFFSINSITSFQLLNQLCSYFSGCPMDQLEDAISTSLPALLAKVTKQKKYAGAKEEL